MAIGARRLRALTRGGAAAAAVVGTAVLGGSGWAGGAALAAFFVSGSAISRLLPRVPSAKHAELDIKGDCRDPWQVAANGGPAALGGVLALRERGTVGRSAGYAVLVGSLAAAAADTWATAFGSRSGARPRLLTTGRPVPPGTSGGVTLAGTAGGLGGAAFVALTAAAAARRPALFPFATLIGFAGMLADSALGATLQGRFRCPRCNEPSEWRQHRCGAATIHQGGLAWLDNDRVNLTTTMLAAGLALAARRRDR